MSFQNRKNKEHDPCFRYLSLFYLNIFLKNQNDIVLVKKKQNLAGCNQVFDRVLSGQPAGSPRVLTFPIFS